ncbi:unnamed protein product [Prunus armeniaca]
MLIGIEGCQETIVQAWEDTPGSVVAKLSFCQLALKRWNNEHVGNIPRKVRFLQNRTDDLQGLASTSEPFNEHKRLAKEMDVFMEREEQAGQRGSQNVLNGIFNQQNSWCTTKEAIGATFCSYFQELFSINGSTDCHAILEKVRSMVTIEHNFSLSMPSTDTEQFCLNILNGGASVQEVNHTLITLIPKVAHPS